jgi:CheY-like chemotaxis protein
MVRRVLLIDDDSTVATYVSDLLGLYGISVDWVPDEWSIGEGIATYGQVDLIIADMMMRTSEAALAALRHLSLEGSAKIPLVVLSGKRDFDGLRRASAMGALGFFLKPPDPVSFPVQLQELVRGGVSQSRGLIGPEFQSFSARSCWVAVHFRDAPELGSRLYNWSLRKTGLVFPKFRFGRFTPIPQQAQWFWVEVEFTGSASEGVRFSEIINERGELNHGTY